MNKQKRCECKEMGVLREHIKELYDPIKELPFVNHKPGKCECTNDLKLYLRNGKKTWLCSNCRLLSDEEVIR